MVWGLSDMTDSMLIAEFAEFAWCEWCYIFRDDLLRVAQHGEYLSIFTHSVYSVCIRYLCRTTVFTVGIDPNKQHRSIEKSCSIDVKSLPWTWGKVPYRPGIFWWILWVSSTCNSLRTDTFYDNVDIWPPYAWACQAFYSNSFDVSIMEEVGHSQLESLRYNYSMSQKQDIVFDCEFILLRWYGRSSNDGHLSGQRRSTKVWAFERMGSLPVVILHCLESIGVDSIRETWTGWTIDDS